MTSKKAFLFLLLASWLALPAISNGQDSDTTSLVKKKHPYPDPHKATIYSAILPGLGQAYNKSYWKIPIVYAGLGIATYFIITNSQHYNDFRNAYNMRVTGEGQYYNIYTESDLLSAEAYYHRYRDLSIISAAFIYMLNIIDADVDAQLHNFNVSDDISFHFTPQLTPNYWTGAFTFTPGFSLVKRF